ncbi:hypothetical protein Tco_0448590 [Tanacetum coccineum]
MKDLVENKPRTDEENEIKMNPRCSALLQNHLPLKEQDPGSFILPCSIGKLDFKNALADLGASISIMPFFYFVILDMVKDIQMPLILRRTLLVTVYAKVDIFRKSISLEVGNEKESYKEIVYKLTEVEKEKYLAPQRVHWCRAILQENENERYNNDSKREELEWENISLNDWMRIRYGKVCKMTGERVLKDYWRERFRDEEDDLEENLEDPEEC